MSDARATITEDDFIESVAAAFQYVSCYHPPDFIAGLAKAYDGEPDGPARDAIGQILVNSRMAALGRRPICQDTGSAGVFVRLGAEARLATRRPLQALCDEAVRKAYRDEANPLRPSMVGDPLGLRLNTGDNTPAIVHVEHVAGAAIDVTVVAKGGGSENKARFTVLNPRASVADWVVETVEGLGAGWCPPGLIGVGVGGTADTAMHLAKTSLLQPIDMHGLLASGPANPAEALRIELYERINSLGIGAQGLGGLTTVVDVKVATWPVHAASKPVGLIPQCAANRHATIRLDGSGPTYLAPPDLAHWPEIARDHAEGGFRRVNLDLLDHKETASWRVGDRLLLSGRLLTARDAAHARIADLTRDRQPLPIPLAGRVLYYVGPVAAAPGEVVGPAGPTTSTRMDPYLSVTLEAGVLATIGKAERGEDATKATARAGVPYLIAVGGAAYLIAQAIRSAEVVAFPELGMEAIHEFVVEDMPVIVGIDTTGASIHNARPKRAHAIASAAGQPLDATARSS